MKKEEYKAQYNVASLNIVVNTLTEELATVSAERDELKERLAKLEPAQPTPTEEKK